MTTRDRLPRRARIGVGAVVVLLIGAIGGGTAAVQYGASALQVSGGGVAAAASGDVQSLDDRGQVWFGIELANDSALPVTLHSVRAAAASNARIGAARVLDLRQGDGGVGLVPADVGGTVGAAIRGARPVEGFVLPAHSRNRYELIVLMDRIRPAEQASISRTAIAYAALGLDHGAESRAVFCIRAPGRDDCRGF